jgi:hypothetical protein
MTMTLLRPALVASMLFGLLAALGACGEGRAGIQDSDRKKNDRRIYTGIESTIEGTDGIVAAMAAPVFAGHRIDPRG